MVRRLAALLAFFGALLAGGEARALDSSRSLTQYNHTAWTIREGVPGYIHALAQTPDGYLWIGSEAGLYRFDGVRAERFAPGQLTGAVDSLAVAPSGDLWIGARPGLWRLSRGRLTGVSLPALAGPYWVEMIAIGRGADVWVATDSQVARFDGRGWQVMESDWGSSRRFLAPGGIWGLAVDRDGVTWAKNLLGLYYLRPGAIRFAKAEGYAGSIIDFARAADGRLWTADDHIGRFYALPELGPSGGPPPPAQLGAAVPPGVLGHALIDRDGALWCANSITYQVCRVRSVTAGGAETFTARDGLSNDVATAILEDREGDIWVGTMGGLDRFAPANVVTETAVPIRATRSDITATAAAVYVADGWVRAPSATPQTERIYRIAEGPPQLLPQTLGDLWAFSAAEGQDAVLAGAGSGLVLLRGAAATPIDLPPGRANAHVVSAALSGSDLWVVLDDRKVFRRRGGVWSEVALPGVRDPAGFVRADTQGGVWLMNDTQLARLGDHGVQVFDHRLDAVFGVTPDGDGVLFCGRTGIARFDGHVLRTLRAEQAPFLGLCRGAVADGLGATWLHTASGIYRVATDQLERAFRDPRVRLDYRLFDARDGLKATASFQQFGGDAVRGPDGRLWFLTVDNVSWIDPRHLERNTVPPPVAIQSLTAGGRVYAGAEGTRLPAGTSNLQIDYTALSLQNPERVRFRYRLDGVDKDWVDAGGRRQAFYTRLGPGRYRFHVIAANNDGVWNTAGATQAFEIPPTFVQSRWFLALVGILAAALLWLVYRLRVRQVAAVIQNRLEERLAERERIARELHDTLLQGVQGLMLRFQAAMESLPAGAPRRALDAALERADEVLVEGRDRVRSLRADGAQGDLAEALSAAADAALDGSETRFQLAVEGTPRPLHPIAADELAAIGREAIANAARHARARWIVATLAYDRKGLTLRIVDDGQGCAPEVLAAGRAGHYGLMGMRERARKIEARLTVSSRPGEGVKVAVAVPARLAFATPERGIHRRLFPV